MEKRTKGEFVPTGGKRLLCFLDDLNMPAIDLFGSQPPLELLRLWIDYGFWYDLQKQTQKFVKVRDSPVPAEVMECERRSNSATWQPVCAGHVHPGIHGAPWWREDQYFTALAESLQPHQHDLPSRKSHNLYTPLKLATATRRRRPRPQAVLSLCVQESQIRRIFSTMINQKLEDFKEDVKPIGDILTQATLKLYSAVSAHFLPTPAKIHYLFNLRDISKVSVRVTVYYPGRLDGMLLKSRHHS